MSGYTTYLRYQRIEEQAKKLGFRLANPKHGGWGNREYQDLVTLCADGKALPIYARDADLFTGTFDHIEVFLNGWERAQQYDQMLRLTDDKKRKKYEAKEVERQEFMRKRAEQKKMYAILANKSEKEVEGII